MQLIEVKTQAGYIWFRQGLWLFFRSPFTFIMVFCVYLLAALLLSLIPVLGNFLPMVLLPIATVGLMAACRDTLLKKPVSPFIMFNELRVGGPIVTRRLLILGLCHAAAIVLALGISAFADGGTLFKLRMLGMPANPNALSVNSELLALAWFAVAYIPIAMLFWFASILVAWHDTPPVKAVFFSAVACWRNRGAFALYALSWIMLTIAVSVFMGILTLLFGDPSLLILSAPIMSLIMAAMLYCSFYATYRGCFALPAISSGPSA